MRGGRPVRLADRETGDERAERPLRMGGRARPGPPARDGTGGLMGMDPKAAADFMTFMQGLTGPGGPFELTEAEVLGARLAVFAGAARNLGEVLAASAAHGDTDYIVTAGGRLSFAEHAARVAALAAALREDYGVRPGDRVAINAANSPD